MKLLVGCSSPPDIGAGGILTYTREIVEGFLEEGHEVHIAAPEPEDWGWVSKNNIKFVETDQNKDPEESVSSLLEYVSKQKIEGIINNDNPYVQSMLPAVAVPSVVIGHLGESVIASLACFQEKWTDYIVAISNDMFSTYVQKYKVPVTKCPIVLNGVKDNGCKDDLRNTDNKLKVVFAGGSNKRKGCMHILSAVTNFSARINDVEFNWFGNAGDSIKKKIKQHTFVNFRGHVSRGEFVNALAEADVLLFPSKSEGCPMAMLEAMSSGVVPIASNGVGAMDSLITSGREGYICHLNNWADEATECLKYLNNNRNVLNDMKRAVRDEFLLRYQRRSVVKRLLELLAKPTVNREIKPDKIIILRWHRPIQKGMKKATVINRVLFRLGVLRKSGQLIIKESLNNSK